MEILYVSSVPSHQEFYRMKNCIRKDVNVTTYGMNEAGFKFHSLILDGLHEIPDVHIFSLVGRSTSLRTHTGLYWKKRKEQSHANLQYQHLGFFNIPVMKQAILGVSFFFNTLSWLIKHKKETDKHIIMDASYITVIPFVMLAAKWIPCKTCAIFCDIYDYMADVKDARENENWRHKIIGKFIGKVYRHLNSMVFLTEQMNQAVNSLTKPYIVMEGLVDTNMKESTNTIENKTPHTVIMYAGALRAQYGLKNLVEGFMHYQDENARLWIFGAGDYADAIKKSAEFDSRIQFLGHAELDEVIQKELEADILVNPRPADLEFTKYSFPSKNMEYMVSGTPVLTTRLPGMPSEYYEYIYTIDGSQPEDITSALKYCMSKSKIELHEKGERSKQFVLFNKNNHIQAKKILELIRR